MTEPICHGPSQTNRERARQLVLKTYGAKRVASWCSVAEDTVYQWLGRGSEQEPIPTARVAAIAAGAKREGFEAPLEVLWPAMAGHLTETPVP
jgi:hypothetical protein